MWIQVYRRFEECSEGCRCNYHLGLRHFKIPIRDLEIFNCYLALRNFKFLFAFFKFQFLNSY